MKQSGYADLGLKDQEVHDEKAPMNTTIKWLLILAAAFVALGVLVDQGICNRWVYHDYAAGIDRRLECFWK